MTIALITTGPRLREVHRLTLGVGLEGAPDCTVCADRRAQVEVNGRALCAPCVEEAVAIGLQELGAC